MPTTAGLTENSRQGFEPENPDRIGLKTELSRNTRWGWGHAYDETPPGLAVYVRNDPVNAVDPDGRDPRYICSEGFCIYGIFPDPPPSSVGHGRGDTGKCAGGSCGGGAGARYHGFDKTNVQKDVKDMLDNRDCKGFIEGLYGSIYKSANPDWTDQQVQQKANTMFMEISKQLAISDYANLSPTITYSMRKGQSNPLYPTALGSADWTAKSPTINLWDPFFYLPSDRAQGQTVIGEAMHIVMRMYDSGFATALGGWKQSGKPGDPSYEASASQYWHSELEKKCK